MGLFNRISDIIEAKVNKVVDENTDPNEQLDLAYRNMQGILEKAEKGLVDVNAGIQKVVAVKKGFEVGIERADNEAKVMIERGKDDLAREFIETKLNLQGQLKNTDVQLATLRESEKNLRGKVAKLKADMTAINSKKEVLKAQYSATEAQVKISESLTGLSDDILDVGKAVQDAEDRIAEKQARANAIDELTDSGVLDSALDQTPSKNVSSFDIDAELEKMKKK